MEGAQWIFCSNQRDEKKEESNVSIAEGKDWRFGLNTTRSVVA